MSGRHSATDKSFPTNDWPFRHRNFESPDIPSTAVLTATIASKGLLLARQCNVLGARLVRIEAGHCNDTLNQVPFMLRRADSRESRGRNSLSFLARGIS